MTEYALNISDEIAYARKWALSRNHAYYSFNNKREDDMLNIKFLPIAETMS